MENLFGRFPHLVEDIFGLLKEETLFCCGQINKAWSKNLDDYRLHLVKRIQRPPKILRRIMAMEQLPVPVLVHFLRYFCDHRIKDCEVNFRISSINQTSVVLGVFVKSKPNGEEVNQYIGSIGQFCYLFSPRDYQSIPTFRVKVSNRTSSKSFLGTGRYGTFTACPIPQDKTGHTKLDSY